MGLDGTRTHITTISILGASATLIAIIGYLFMKSDRKKPKRKSASIKLNCIQIEQQQQKQHEETLINNKKMMNSNSNSFSDNTIASEKNNIEPNINITITSNSNNSGSSSNSGTNLINKKNDKKKLANQINNENVNNNNNNHQDHVVPNMDNLNDSLVKDHTTNDVVSCQSFNDENFNHITNGSPSINLIKTTSSSVDNKHLKNISNNLDNTNKTQLLKTLSNELIEINKNQKENQINLIAKENNNEQHSDELVVNDQAILLNNQLDKAGCDEIIIEKENSTELNTNISLLAENFAEFAGDSLLSSSSLLIVDEQQINGQQTEVVLIEADKLSESSTDSGNGKSEIALNDDDAATTKSINIETIEDNNSQVLTKQECLINDKSINGNDEEVDEEQHQVVPDNTKLNNVSSSQSQSPSPSHSPSLPSSSSSSSSSASAASSQRNTNKKQFSNQSSTNNSSNGFDSSLSHTHSTTPTPTPNNTSDKKLNTKRSSFNKNSKSQHQQLQQQQNDFEKYSTTKLNKNLEETNNNSNNLKSSSSSSSSAATETSTNKTTTTTKSTNDKKSTSEYQDLVVYEFNFPRKFCGKLIGKNGIHVDSIRSKTHTQIAVRNDPNLEDLQIVCVSGLMEDVDQALDIISNRFPAKHYPQISFKPISKPIVYRRYNMEKNSLFQQSKVLVAPNMFVSLSDLINDRTNKDYLIDVHVTAVVNASQVFVQLPTHSTYDGLQKLDENMLNVYNSQTEMVPQMNEPIEYGSICAAPTSYGWHRAIVINYQSKEEALQLVPDFAEDCGIATVKFLDYGGYLNIPINQLKQLRSDFMLLPFQAVECYLKGIYPIEGTEEEGKAFLSKFIKNSSLQASLVEYADDGIPQIKLFVTNESYKECCVNSELIKFGIVNSYENCQSNIIPNNNNNNNEYQIVQNFNRDDLNTINRSFSNEQTIN